MNIESSVLDVLGNSVINENTLKLTGQLDRALYTKTNKVLELAGGKWNRKAQAHIFDGDASDIIEQVILTGKITDKKSEMGYFPTPMSVGIQLFEQADIQPGLSVLEPSVGQGALAIPMLMIGAKVTAYEIDPTNIKELNEIVKNKAFVLHQADFLTVEPEPVFDRVVMNPPFAKQADIEHVRHAFKFLRPGGVLVAVMSAAVEFRSNTRAIVFRELLEGSNGTITRLPENSFKESGTGVNTVIVRMER